MVPSRVVVVEGGFRYETAVMPYTVGFRLKNQEFQKLVLTLNLINTVRYNLF